MRAWIAKELQWCAFPDRRLGMRFERLVEQLSASSRDLFASAVVGEAEPSGDEKERLNRNRPTGPSPDSALTA